LLLSLGLQGNPHKALQPYGNSFSRLLHKTAASRSVLAENVQGMSDSHLGFYPMSPAGGDDEQWVRPRS
jgi:hypothetical protein